MLKWRASSWNKDLAARRGAAMADEFKKKGVNVLLGPVVGPAWRVTLSGRNWEGFAADPYLSGSLDAQSIIGIQGQGVITSTKVRYTFLISMFLLVLTCCLVSITLPTNKRPTETPTRTSSPCRPTLMTRPCMSSTFGIYYSIGHIWVFSFVLIVAGPSRMPFMPAQVTSCVPTSALTTRMDVPIARL